MYLDIWPVGGLVFGTLEVSRSAYAYFLISFQAGPFVTVPGLTEAPNRRFEISVPVSGPWIWPQMHTCIFKVEPLPSPSGSSPEAGRASPCPGTCFGNTARPAPEEEPGEGGGIYGWTGRLTSITSVAILARS